MARIEGTGPKPPTVSQRVRRAVPRFRLEPLAVIAVLSPVVLLAPDAWLEAVALAVVLQAAWSRGHHDGVNDMAEAVRRELRRDNPAA